MPQGKMAIGHVRYSTTGASKKENAQPMVVRHKKGNLAVVHNGNLTNAVELKRELEEELGIIPNSVNLELVDRITEKLVNKGVISNEYVSIFVIYTDIDITNIKLQKEEVSEAKWCSKAELNEFIKNNHIIPHVREYEILNQLLETKEHRKI